jgi:myo-inositol 2-dehydrogenase/D-chiro-inositol 1-dehydrogenase
MTKCPVVDIVVVGAGLIGPRHCAHVVQNPNVNLFAVVDPLVKSELVAKKFHTLHFYTIADMIQYCDEKAIWYPHGAIVCTPNHTHIEIAAELAHHGIHLLVEKPLSSNPQECKALKQYCQGQNVQLLVGHHRRFNAYVLETKRNLVQLGRIIAVQGTWTLRKPDSYFVSGKWRTDKAQGGGALMINLVHDLDILQYLFGPIHQIYAELLDKQRNYDSDEGAVLTLKFKNGISGTFICSDNVTSPFNFESGTGENPTIPFSDDLQGVYRIFGSNGTLSMPDLNLFYQPLALTDDENSWLNPIIKKPLVDDRNKTLYSMLPFDLQLQHFVNIINGTEAPSCTADDGMSALLCIDAVARSVESGKPEIVLDPESIIPDYTCLTGGSIPAKKPQPLSTKPNNRVYRPCL